MRGVVGSQLVDETASVLDEDELLEFALRAAAGQESDQGHAGQTHSQEGQGQFQTKAHASPYSWARRYPTP